eukprot:SAG31_NODE_11661_length_1008_cov_1.863586_1_plen_54_part_10
MFEKEDQGVMGGNSDGAAGDATRERDFDVLEAPVPSPAAHTAAAQNTAAVRMRA